MDSHSVYICFYKDDNGITIGHGISHKNNFSDKINEEINIEKSISNISDLFDLFSHSMMGYLDMLPFIAMTGTIITYGIQGEELKDFCSENCLTHESHENRDVYCLSGEKFPEFNLISQRAESSNLVGKQVPKMLLIGIVSSLDHQISELIKAILRKYPSMISDSDKQVSIRDVFRAESLDDFKEIMLDKEVENVTRESFADQVKWFEKKLSLSKNIKDNYQPWSSLIEIIERRNLFAHTNGIVNNIYIKKISEATGSIPKITKGEELYVSPKYFKNALENIFEFGVKLTQVVWRKLETGDTKFSDGTLGDLGFELIERGEYKLAISILDFALHGIHGSKDELRRRMNVVNLANAYLLGGNLEKSKEVIESENWDIVSDTFAISVAGVRKDIDGVIRYMRRLSSDDEWDGTFLEKWPVFFHIRDDDRFRQAFKDIYGRDYSPETIGKHNVIQNFMASVKKKMNAQAIEINDPALEPKKLPSRSSKE